MAEQPPRRPAGHTGKQRTLFQLRLCRRGSMKPRTGTRHPESQTGSRAGRSNGRRGIGERSGGELRTRNRKRSRLRRKRPTTGKGTVPGWKASSPAHRRKRRGRQDAARRKCGKRGPHSSEAEGRPKDGARSAPDMQVKTSGVGDAALPAGSACVPFPALCFRADLCFRPLA